MLVLLRRSQKDLEAASGAVVWIQSVEHCPSTDAWKRLRTGCQPHRHEGPLLGHCGHSKIGDGASNLTVSSVRSLPRCFAWLDRRLFQGWKARNKICDINVLCMIDLRMVKNRTLQQSPPASLDDLRRRVE